MDRIKQTETSRKWRIRIKDERIRALIASRLDRLAFGNRGMVKPVAEESANFASIMDGYRVYFMKAGQYHHHPAMRRDKNTQTKDIQTAKRLAAEWSKENGSEN